MRTQKQFCIIGLGYFGMNLATILSKEGAEILAIDNNPERIDEISEIVTHAVCMDSTDERALRSLGLLDMDAVIVAIGEDFESSITTTAILQSINVKKIYSRIVSPIHERLLRLMGVAEMLMPEAEAAGHLASRLLLDGIIGSFAIGEEYGVFEIPVPEHFIRSSIIETNIRENHKLNIVTIKKVNKDGFNNMIQSDNVRVTGVPSPHTILEEGDILVVFGKEKDVKHLLSLK